MDECCEDGECLRLRGELILLVRLRRDHADLDDARAYWDARIAALVADLAGRCQCTDAA